MDNEWTGEIEEPYKIIEIGQELLDLIDRLVEQRDVISLDLLDATSCATSWHRRCGRVISTY